MQWTNTTKVHWIIQRAEQRPLLPVQELECHPRDDRLTGKAKKNDNMDHNNNVATPKVGKEGHCK